MLKIAVIQTSVREGRNGAKVASWVLDKVTSMGLEGVEFGLIDLANYKLPFLGVTPTEEEMKTIKEWQDIHTKYDGFILVLGEYNHNVPGAFKNASDYLMPQLSNKALGYVGYGGLGGARSVMLHRLMAAEQGLATVKRSVHLSIFTDFVNMSEFKPNEEIIMPALKEMTSQVVLWSKALKEIRK